MLKQMTALVELFAAHVPDRSTLDELHRIISDRNSRHQAHDLFQRIRRKTLDASQRGDKCAECQYLFEEVCAKTLYNLTPTSRPFDPDSPYWIVPNALTLARRLGIEEANITRIVAA